MAGYSGTPLAKKLGIKDGLRFALVNAPRGFNELRMQKGRVSLDKDSDEVDLILLFAKTRLALAKDFARLASRLKPAGMLWVAWPKKASGVKTDLSFDVVQKTGLAAGLVDTKICAVDEVWSGLKFVIRLKDRASRVPSK